MDEQHERERSRQGGIRAHKEASERMDEERERELARRRRAARAKRRRKRKIQRMILIAAMVLILLLFILLVRAVVRKVSGAGDKKASKATEVEVDGKTEESKEAEATINIAGDIIMHKPFLTSSVYTEDGETYDYTSIFTYIKDYYEDADFSLCTTEYALTGGDYSGYPTFCAPDAIADALKASGMDMFLLANNHIYDGGDEGLQRTMEVLDDDGIVYTGVRKTTDEKKYVVQDINGIKVGIFNYVIETDEVNGQKTINGISVSDDSADLINSFQEADPQSLYDDVEQIMSDMKDDGVEYTIACLHWGVEYQTQENSDQDAIAQELCDMGIDALIASHPHVIEPVDLIESSDGDHQMVCAYAIGNHLSNQRTEYMDGLTNGYSEDGMMVKLIIKRDAKGNISLDGADFTPTWVYMDQNPDNEYYILPLDDPDNLETLTGLSNISQDVEDSLERTNGITGDGVEKVQSALPIAK